MADPYPTAAGRLPSSFPPPLSRAPKFFPGHLTIRNLKDHGRLHATIVDHVAFGICVGEQEPFD